jgi:hypothetical protein
MNLWPQDAGNMRSLELNLVGELGGGGVWNGMLWVGDDFFISHGQEGGGERELVLGKHPDLMVGPPTATVYPTNDRKFEILQFFAKNFETV